MGERRVRNAEVEGSIPFDSTDGNSLLKVYYTYHLMVRRAA